MKKNNIEGLSLKELRDLRILMNGTRWMLELEVMDAATRRDAGLQKLRVHQAILKLENS